MGSLCPFRRVGLLEEGCISKNYVIHLSVSVGTCHHCHHLLPIKVKPDVVWAEGTDCVDCFPTTSSSLCFCSHFLSMCILHHKLSVALNGVSLGIARKQHWGKSQGGPGEEASSTFLHGSPIQHYTAVLVTVTKCWWMNWNKISILEQKSQGYSKLAIQP